MRDYSSGDFYLAEVDYEDKKHPSVKWVIQTSKPTNCTSSSSFNIVYGGEVPFGPEDFIYTAFIFCSN